MAEKNFRDYLIHSKHPDESEEEEGGEARVRAAQRQATPAPAGPDNPRRIVEKPQRVEPFPPELKAYFEKLVQDREK